MDPVDLNFTYSIVGPPMSVVLGKRASARDGSAAGVAVSMKGARPRLSTEWLEWWLLRTAEEWAGGRARRRPGRARLWLERHGLLLASLGVLLLAVEAGVVLAWRFHLV